MKNIKINYKKLKEITQKLIDDIDKDLKKGKKLTDKLALFYIDINNKKYYYTYYEIDKSLNDIYNSYRLVNYKKAKNLLLNQIYEKNTL